MAKRERNPERDQLVQELLAEYQPKDLDQLITFSLDTFASMEFLTGRQHFSGQVVKHLFPMELIVPGFLAYHLLSHSIGLR